MIDARPDALPLSSPGSPEDAPRFDELMLAMDVVDTLRHEEAAVERELRADVRDRTLVERMRSLYAAQGIEVSDALITDAIRALHEDRFVFRPPPRSFAVRLAGLYIGRGRWLRRALAVSSIVITIGLVWAEAPTWIDAARDYASREEIRELNRLGAAAKLAHDALGQAAVSADARTEVANRWQRLVAALDAGDLATAGAAMVDVEALRVDLERAYELRIVSRPGAETGVWRHPKGNATAENFYIVVEPVVAGRVVEIAVLNEETKRIENARRFGVRVSSAVYEQVRRDKLDDGLLQDDRFGEKRRGDLQPIYRFPVVGGFITEW